MRLIPDEGGTATPTPEYEDPISVYTDPNSGKAQEILKVIVDESDDTLSINSWARGQAIPFSDYTRKNYSKVSLQNNDSTRNNGGFGPERYPNPSGFGGFGPERYPEYFVKPDGDRGGGGGGGGGDGDPPKPDKKSNVKVPDISGDPIINA